MRYLRLPGRVPGPGPRELEPCFFVLCKRHWINRVPGAHQGDSLCIPSTLTLTVGRWSCRLTSNLIGCPSEHRRGPGVTVTSYGRDHFKLVNMIVTARSHGSSSSLRSVLFLSVKYLVCVNYFMFRYRSLQGESPQMARPRGGLEPSARS